MAPRLAHLARARFEPARTVQRMNEKYFKNNIFVSQPLFTITKVNQIMKYKINNIWQHKTNHRCLIEYWLFNALFCTIKESFSLLRYFK